MRMLNRSIQFALLLVTLFFVGCAEGPLWRLGYLNPWAVSQWREEEELLSSYSEVGTRIDQIRRSAKGMSPGEAEEAVAYLRDVVLNEDLLKTRIDAVQTTSLLRSPAAIDAMIVYLEDPNPEIRWIAAEGLGNQPAANAIPVLRSVIEKENDLDVRVAATRSLGNFEREPQAVEALEVALLDREPVMQFRAMESLGKVTGKNFGSDATKWRDYLSGKPVQNENRFAERVRSIF